MSVEIHQLDLNPPPEYLYDIFSPTAPELSTKGFKKLWEGIWNGSVQVWIWSGDVVGFMALTVEGEWLHIFYFRGMGVKGNVGEMGEILSDIAKSQGLKGLSITCGDSVRARLFGSLPGTQITQVNDKFSLELAL